jgi:ABC-type molybdate transport system substrate-binding protein
MAIAGKISGRVTGPDGDTPLAGISVYARNPTSASFTSVTTDASGNYTIGGLLPSGNYTVSFSDPAGNYAQEYFDNVSSWNSANPVEVTQGQTRSGINSSMAIAGKISGRVTGPDGATPLAGISVSTPNPTSAWFTPVTTDASGNYTIGGFASGNYIVSFSDPAGNYAQEYFDNVPSWNSANPVEVTQGQTRSGINASMAIAGKISGRVIGPDGATPLAGISVYASNSISGSSATTDASGNYTVGGLPSGNYTVSFSDPAGNYAQEYFDNVPSWNSANPVEVTQGQTRSGINASMAIAGKISGRVTGPDGATPLAGISVSASNPISGSSATTDASGNYPVGGLPSGNYTVRFSDRAGSYAEEYFNDVAPDYAILVQVTEGQTLSDIDASLAIAGKISGRVTGPDGIGLGGIYVHTYLKSNIGNWIGRNSERTDASGNYTIGGFTSGNYIVSFSDPGGNYASEYFNNVSSINSATLINLGSGERRSEVNARLGSPYQNWSESFTSAYAADFDAVKDTDRDGLSNLEEYALGSDPLAAGRSAVVFSQVTENGNTYLQLSVQRNYSATGVRIEGLSSSTLGDESSWSTSSTVTVEDTPNQFTVRDAVPMQTGGRRFLKLRFTLEN